MCHSMARHACTDFPQPQFGPGPNPSSLGSLQNSDGMPFPHSSTIPVLLPIIIIPSQRNTAPSLHRHLLLMIPPPSQGAP